MTHDIPTASLSTHRVLLASMFLLTLVCLVGALLLTPEKWAALVQHPARPLATTTVFQGAYLLRMMLVVFALTLPLGVWSLCKLQAALQPRTQSPVSSSTNPSRDSRRWLWTIAGLTMLALVVRSWRITESLWYDEIAALLEFARHGPLVCVGNYFDPVNHILHTAFTSLTLDLLGDIELGLRLPALIFSLLSVWAVAELVRQVASNHAAILAAALIAILPVSVLEGIEARGYSMMIVASAASTALLLRAMNNGRAGTWLAYAATLAAGIWAHPVTLCVAGGHLLATTVTTLGNTHPRTLIVQHCIALSIAACLTLTLYAPVIPDMRAMQDYYDATTQQQPRLFGEEGGRMICMLGGSWCLWLALPGWLLLAAGTWRAWNSNTARVLVLCLLGSLLLLAAIIVLRGTWFYARFAFFSLPFAAALVAIGIERFGTQRAILGWVAFAGIGVAAVIDLATRPPKQPLRDAAAWILHHQQPGDVTLVIDLRHQVMDFYAINTEISVRHSTQHGIDLAQKLDEVRPSWVVVLYPQSVPQQRFELLQQLGYTQRIAFDGWVDWGNGNVLILSQ